MQIHSVPGLPPSGGYEIIATAMDLFSRYLFAYPTTNQDSKTNAKVIIIDIMTKHAYLPTTLISDEGTAFMSRVIKEVAGVLGITLNHSNTKYAQKIGLLERSYASIKQALEIETCERRSLCHKYVSIAVLNYNTSYHANSHPDNPYQTNQSRHVNGKQSRKLSLNMTIYTPELGSVNMKSQSLIAITII